LLQSLLFFIGKGIIGQPGGCILRLTFRILSTFLAIKLFRLLFSVFTSLWLFPLLFLALMVPLPFVDLASPWLESFTAQSAAGLARLAGLSAVQQGGEITLPNTAITVGAPCSGLRSLVTMVTVGVVWIYIVEGRPAAKGLLLLAVIPLVALSNVLRIAILLAVAEFFGEDVALSYYHDWSSPILFLMALGLLLILGKVLGCSRVREDLF